MIIRMSDLSSTFNSIFLHKSSFSAIALYDYEAEKPDELSLRENCLVYVLRKNDDGYDLLIFDNYLIDEIAKTILKIRVY